LPESVIVDVEEAFKDRVLRVKKILKGFFDKYFSDDPKTQLELASDLQQTLHQCGILGPISNLALGDLVLDLSKEVMHHGDPVPVNPLCTLTVEKLKKRFKVANIPGYGNCIIILKRHFPKQWEKELEKQGYSVFEQLYGDEPCVLVRLNPRENKKKRS